MSYEKMRLIKADIWAFKIDAVLSDSFGCQSNTGELTVRISLCVSFIDIWDLQ